MITLFGQIDKNDYEFVKERYGEPRFAIPAPFIKKNGKYEKISPHSSRFIYPDGQIREVFHIKPIYYATTDGQWRPLSEVASFYGNTRGMTLKEGWEEKMDFQYLIWYINRLDTMKSKYGIQVSFPQEWAGKQLVPIKRPLLIQGSGDPIYPTCDGGVWQQYASSSGVAWATIRVDAGTNSITDEDYLLLEIVADAVGHTNEFRIIRRNILTFNTNIGTGMTISAVTLSIHGYTAYLKADTFTTPAAPDMNVYSAAPASHSALEAGDYDSIGTTAYCNTAVTYADWADDYHNWAFNATGIAAIVKDGTTDLGMRNANHDVANSAPTWTAAASASLYAQSSETTGTTSDPKLVVTYAAAVVSPTVTTQAVTDKATTTGTGNGNITATGGANATRHGVCWNAGTSGDPKITDSEAHADGDFGTGAFTQAITGLSAGTAYRVAAYATNSAGTSYGATVDYVTTFVKALSQSVKTISSSQKLTSTKKLQSIKTVSVFAKATTFVKSLIQSFKVAPVLSNVLTALKTLSQVIQVVPTIGKLSTFYKNLTQSLNVVPIYENALTAIKSFIESVIVISTHSLIKTFLRSYTEVVSIVSNTVNKIVKTFIETIKTSPILQNVLTSFKVLSDTIKIVGRLTFNNIRLLIERIIVVPVYSGILVAYKLLTDSIVTIPFLLRNTGHSFYEQIKTSSILQSGLSALKTLSETIKTYSKYSLITATILFENIIVNPIYNTALTALKTISDTIKVISRSIKTPVRIFNEIFTVSDPLVGFLNVFTRVCSEVLSIGDKVIDKALTAFKLLTDRVKIAVVFLTAGVFIKVLSQSIVIVDRFAKSNIRIFTEIIKVVSNRLTDITKIFTERIVIVVSVFKSVPKIFIETISVLSNSIVIGLKLLKEVINVTGSIVKFIFVGIFIEVIKTYDVISKSIPKIFTETLSVVLSFTVLPLKLLIEIVSVVGSFAINSISKLLLEVIKINYNIAKLTPKIFTEIISVVGSFFKGGLKTFTETISVAGQFILGQISKLLIERVYMGFQYLYEATFFKVLTTEVIKVVSSSANQGVKIFTETVSVAGQFILGLISKLLIEIVKVNYVIKKYLPKAFAEVIKISSSPFNTPIKIFKEVLNIGISFVYLPMKFIKNTIKVVQSHLTVLTAGRLFSETIKVVINLFKIGTSFILFENVKVNGIKATFVIGRIFKERIITFRNIIKLVLNGIQVGLWKKIARVTNGVWHKINRNDN
jgi:hypothetical protein